MNGKPLVERATDKTNHAYALARRLPFALEFDPNRESGSFWIPVFSVVLSFVFCGILIALNGFNPLTVYMKMAQGAFGTFFGISETLVKAIPLLLCGLGVAVAYKISVWNIGAEGQLLMGAIAATAVTVYFPDLPESLYIPAMMAAGIAAGALWGLLAAIPRAYFRVNELITTLMLNYVALLLLDYLVFGPWKDPQGYNFPGTPMFSLSQQLLTLGGTRLHLGLLFGLIAAVLYAFVMDRTRWGYEMRVIGANPAAAESAGIPIRIHILAALAVGGGLAGLAGMSEVSGVAHRLMYGLSPGYGYTAIIVAWIARLNPWGMIAASLFFGSLIVGGYSVQTIGLPSSMSLMMQGATLFFLMGGEVLSRFRLKRKARPQP